MMQKVLLIWAAISSFNLVNQAACELQLDFEHIVYGVQDKEVILKCGIISDLDIKQVIWYKENEYDRTRPDTIYYYEPAISIDRPTMNRASRSANGTSLTIYPLMLADEGRYRCRVQVWQSNSTMSIPEEKSATMKLVVYVPPQREQLSTFSAQKNITLTCKAFNAKPAAQIMWLKTTPQGESQQLFSQKFVTKSHDELSDSTGHLYYMLSKKDNSVRLSCVIMHPETNTTVYKNVTMVSPVIQNAVDILVDRLGGEITYSSVINQDDEDSAASFVKITADPGLEINYNSSVTLSASAPGVFPQPSFVWWTGDQAAYSGSELYIPHVDRNQIYYVLAQNPVGRVLLSVPLTIVDTENVEGNSNTTNTKDDNKTPEDTMNGGLIAACIIAAMVFLLLVGLTIWYCTCRNPPNEGIPNVRKKKDSKRHIEEEDAFMSHHQKPLMRTTSTQTLEGKRQNQKRESQRFATPDDSPVVSKPLKSDKTHTPPPEYATKPRPMEKHLQEYDESASFVGDYGSNVGLESNPSVENLHSALEEDSHSEESVPDSEDSTSVKVPHRREDVV
ncbi:uncharacterized protein LOC120327297 isoform X1 [Styela clava]